MPPVRKDTGGKSSDRTARPSDSTTALCSHSGSDMQFLEELAMKEKHRRKHGSAAKFNIKKTECETGVSSVAKHVEHYSHLDSSNGDSTEGTGLPRTSDQYPEDKTENDNQVSKNDIDKNMTDGRQINGQTVESIGINGYHTVITRKSLKTTEEDIAKKKAYYNELVKKLEMQNNATDDEHTDDTVTETLNGQSGKTMEPIKVLEKLYIDEDEVSADKESDSNPVTAVEEDEIYDSSPDDSNNTLWESHVPPAVVKATKTEDHITGSFTDNITSQDNHAGDTLTYTDNTESPVTARPISKSEESDKFMEHRKEQKTQYNSKMKEVSEMVDGLLEATGLDLVLKRRQLSSSSYKGILSDSIAGKNVSVAIPSNTFPDNKEDENKINTIVYTSVLDTRTDSLRTEKKPYLMKTVEAHDDLDKTHMESSARVGSGLHSNRVLVNSTENIYSNSKSLFLFDSDLTDQPISMVGLDLNRERPKKLPRSPLHTSQSASTRYDSVRPPRQPVIKSESNAPKQFGKRRAIVNSDKIENIKPDNKIISSNKQGSVKRNQHNQPGANKARCAPPAEHYVAENHNKPEVQRPRLRPIPLKSGAVWENGKLEITVRGPTYLSPFDADALKSDMTKKSASLDSSVQDGCLHLTAKGIPGFLPPISSNQKSIETVDPVSLEVILIPEKKHQFRRRTSRARIHPGPIRRLIRRNAFTPLNRDILEDRALVSPFDTSLCPDKCPRLHPHRIASSRSEVTDKIGQPKCHHAPLKKITSDFITFKLGS